MDRAGNREYLPTLIGSGARGDERTRGERRLDHQAALCEAADEAIALWKVMRRRRGAGRELRKQQPAARDLGCECRVALRIGYVDARTEDGDGAARACKSAAVGGGIDAERKAGDDREARVAQRAREALGVALALGARVTASDDSERRARGKLDATRGVEQRRRIGDFEQAARIVVVGERDDPAPGCERELQPARQPGVLRHAALRGAYHIERADRPRDVHDQRVGYPVEDAKHKRQTGGLVGPRDERIARVASLSRVAHRATERVEREHMADLESVGPTAIDADDLLRAGFADAPYAAVDPDDTAAELRR